MTNLSQASPPQPDSIQQPSSAQSSFAVKPEWTILDVWKAKLSENRDNAKNWKALFRLIESDARRTDSMIEDLWKATIKLKAARQDNDSASASYWRSLDDAVKKLDEDFKLKLEKQLDDVHSLASIMVKTRLDTAKDLAERWLDSN
ncbi:hypothetical protein N7454_001365 [Penicillium verhagenii]|nr:hypothetical protein N7454_001365 [Penicillium verhagenii]